jgi:hypothetical protein
MCVLSRGKPPQGEPEWRLTGAGSRRTEYEL